MGVAIGQGLEDVATGGGDRWVWLGCNMKWIVQLLHKANFNNKIT